jgi:beta-lactamase regulating signal transducer with metallopeptidase domain
MLAIGGLIGLPLLSLALPRLNVLPRWMDAKPLSTFDELALSNANPLPLKQTSNPPRDTPKSFEPMTPVAPPRDLDENLGQSGAFPAFTDWTISQWTLFVWLGGVLCALAPVMAGLLSLARLRRMSGLFIQDHSIETLKELQATIGYYRPIRLLISAHRRMPMMWGALRPAILLPEDAERWPAERQKLVLLHELAHVQRHDYLALLLTRFACALHWFNPFAWIAARQIGLEQDQACDDIVLAKGAAADCYAEEVLQFAATQGNTPIGNAQRRSRWPGLPSWRAGSSPFSTLPATAPR